MSKETILNLNKNFTEALRNKNNLVLLSGYRGWYGSRIMGTITTATCVDSIYSKFVYYDWDANWDQVYGVVKTSKIQKILKTCLDSAMEDDDNGDYPIKKSFIICFTKNGLPSVFLQIKVDIRYESREGILNESEIN